MKTSTKSLIVATLLSAIYASSAIALEQNLIRFFQPEPLPTIPANSSGVSITTPDELPAPTLTLSLEPSSHNSTATQIYVAKLGTDIAPMTSCKAYIDAGLGEGMDGVYELNNGTTTYPAYCNQTAFGGGWTAVLAQYQNSPIAWTGGAQVKYDPLLTQGTGWSFTTSQIPVHNEVGFSQTSFDGLSIPKYLVNYSYTTGNIAKTPVFDNNGVAYHIHRDTGSYHEHHDPDLGLTSISYWNNTLTIDRAGRIGYDFAFSINAPYLSGRTFSYSGSIRHEQNVAGAYLLWVR